MPDPRHQFDKLGRATITWPSLIARSQESGWQWRGLVARDVTVSFRYRVIRLWKRPLQELLPAEPGR
jgi:hypothetical protein